MGLCAGWEVVCPDGLVRYFPFHNEGDAKSMAEAASKPLPRERQGGDDRPGCSGWPKPSSLELSQPPCSGGQHDVRPIPFSDV